MKARTAAALYVRAKSLENRAARARVRKKLDEKGGGGAGVFKKASAGKVGRVRALLKYFRGEKLFRVLTERNYPGIYSILQPTRACSVREYTRGFIYTENLRSAARVLFCCRVFLDETHSRGKFKV